MNVITTHHLKILDNETISLTQLLSESINYAVIVTHCFLIYLETKVLLASIMQTTKELTTLIDNDFDLVNQLATYQEKLKAVYDKMKWPKIICRYLLKKAFANIELMIVNIHEHDADVLKIPKTELPIDALMQELNKPLNKSMLEQSIAELETGKVIQHELIYD